MTRLPRPLIAVLCLLPLLLAGCDSSTPTGPATVTVLASIETSGFVIVYTDDSEPQDKYQRIDGELYDSGGVLRDSFSVRKHESEPINVRRWGADNYLIVAIAINDRGDTVGTGTFPDIVVNGLP